ncbi:MAG: hypothetical protein ACKVX7_18605 [Planctomycetota bacterium]
MIKKIDGKLGRFIQAMGRIPPLRRVGKAFLTFVQNSPTLQTHVVSRMVPRRKGNVEKLALHEMESVLRRIAKSSRRIIVGPWLSEVGFEVLYWIPFLNWAVRHYNIDQSRLVVISRGGTAGWYRTIGGRYVDIFDHFLPDQFRDGNERRVEAAGGQKHRAVSDFDQQVIDKVGQIMEWSSDGFDLLHPSVMYNFFTPYWRRKVPFTYLKAHFEPRRFEPQERNALPIDLPADYVAAKFYFSACFPDNPANRAFISSFLMRVAHGATVVLLSSGLKIDDHQDWLPDLEKSGKLINLAGLMPPERNLEIQTAVVSRARQFIGTYGGFSYLAPLYGVPSVALYSEPQHFLPVHLEVAQEVFRSEGFGSFSAMNVRDLERLGMLNGMHQ